MAIRGFKSRALKRFSKNGDARGLPPENLRKIATILGIMDGPAPDVMTSLAAYRLHPLHGGRKGQWSVTVTANRRITFRFDGVDAWDVDLIDYH